MTETFQISPQQAALYEEQFVPALFTHWVEPTLMAAQVGPGQRVLDVACGTGIVARHAAERVGPGGSVVGVDLNPAMLQVAAQVSPDLDWRQGDAAALPLPDDDVDVTVCQSALMFFPDVVAALREMGRVTRAGGRVAVQVFDLLDDQPAYGPWAAMVARHAGPEAVRMLGTYWVHGDRDRLAAQFARAGITVTSVHDHEQPATFTSVEGMVRTEVGSTPLADRLSPAQLDRIIADSADVYRPFRTPGETALTIPLAGYVMVGEPT
ncbi:class I SAM-dependent methyltransferase [Ornithinicoccus halotolerans]|uniref:class I SAM-dependent methyltransferase n=1 Tax=Ornithinicoccus halotolerans TaxID=1748220 RepID=UPI001297D241|nr:methyltransferase domain-containing protein [Ornithinicoccus halotolerans]